MEWRNPRRTTVAKLSTSAKRENLKTQKQLYLNYLNSATLLIFPHKLPWGTLLGSPNRGDSKQVFYLQL